VKLESPETVTRSEAADLQVLADFRRSCPCVQVLLGVTLDAAAAGRPVDMGPAAEDAAAASDFRAFWGDKAELRRFPVRTHPLPSLSPCAACASAAQLQIVINM